MAGTNVAQVEADGSHLLSGSIASTIDYTWDDASQLTDVSDANSAYAYTYDADGRVLTTSNSGTSGVPTVVLTNTYDAASNRTKLTSTIGGAADFENDYSFDNLSRLTRVDQIGQGGGNTVASKRVDFSYDDASRLSSIVRDYKPSGSWVEVATTAFSYDTIDRLTGIDHKQGGSNLFTGYTYTFDHANRITGITSQDGTVAYTYDATNQITGADYSYQTDETFTWTANGNRNDTGYSTGTNNKMSSDGVYNYTYDHEGNLTLRVKISDSSRTEYTWDPRNRLTNITTRATVNGAATSTVDYVYDTFDRRISKSYDADGAGAGGSVTSHYVYDGSDNAQVILQFDGSNNLTHRDLWALAQIFADEDASHAMLWDLADNLGTVRDLINNSGTVQNHLDYNSFGTVTSETHSAVDFLMGFAGMVRDEETGMSYAWHRYQQNGRWLSEDPIQFLAGDPNLGRVTANAPINHCDPSGLFEEPPIPQAIQGIIDMSDTPGGYSGVIGNPNKYETPVEYTNRVYGVSAASGGSNWSLLDSYANGFNWAFGSGYSDFMCDYVVYPTITTFVSNDSLANASDATLITGTVFVSVPLGLIIFAGGEIALGVGSVGTWFWGPPIVITATSATGATLARDPDAPLHWAQTAADAGASLESLIGSSFGGDSSGSFGPPSTDAMTDIFGNGGNLQAPDVPAGPTFELGPPPFEPDHLPPNFGNWNPMGNWDPIQFDPTDIPGTDGR